MWPSLIDIGYNWVSDSFKKSQVPFSELIMGSYLGRFISNPEQEMSSKPRDLDKLLSEFNVVKLNNPNTNLEEVIKERLWSRRFLESHLQPRDREGLITALKFMVLTQPIHYRAQHLQNGNGAKQNNRKVKISQAQRKELTAIFIEAAKTFFDLDKDEGLLSLKRSLYFDEVNEVRERLERSPKAKVTDSDLKLMLDIRTEVKCDELEDQYMEFISRALPEGPIACLLSIL